MVPRPFAREDVAPEEMEIALGGCSLGRAISAVTPTYGNSWGRRESYAVDPDAGDQTSAGSSGTAFGYCELAGKVLKVTATRPLAARVMALNTSGSSRQRLSVIRGTRRGNGMADATLRDYSNGSSRSTARRPTCPDVAALFAVVNERRVKWKWYGCRRFRYQSVAGREPRRSSLFGCGESACAPTRRITRIPRR